MVANKSDIPFFSGQPPLSSQDTNIKLAEFDIDLLEGMFIVLGLLDSPLDFEGKCKDKFPTVCLCVLLLFPDDISKSLSAFFLLCNFVAQLKKNLKETPIGFYIKNL